MRTAAIPNRPRTSQLKSFPAPTGGWIKNRNLATPNMQGMAPGAEVLENFFPTASGAMLRRGSERYATLGDGNLPVTSLFSYKNGNQEELFASTANAVYNVTTITSAFNYLLATETGDTLVTDAGDNFGELSTFGLDVLTGQTGGDWVVVQFATSGGVFLRGVNGVDTPFVYDGTTWATTPAITGAVPEDLNYVWVYKNRLFFVEKESLSAWYLPVDSIGGAATEFPLGGVFTLGGRLLFGASWSLGDGASGGLSAQCVFVSTEGEVAVYQGTDPSSATDWSLVGVYRIGKPLGKQAFIRAGGDIVIATDIGFVPLSQAIQRDYAALSPSAVSFPIEDAWREAVELRSGTEWRCEVWPSKQMVVVALPTVNEQRKEWFVANTRTGAWGDFTGWDATCLETFRGRLFFGSSAGRVVEANVTGSDEGDTFAGAYVPLFDDFRMPGSMKVAELARAIVRAGVEINALVSMQADFEVKLPAAPDATLISSSSTWGDAIWGQSVWGQAASTSTFQDWHSVGEYGYALAPSLQITSGENVPLDAEIIRMDITYTAGDIVT